jgi:hypothetical protein
VKRGEGGPERARERMRGDGMNPHPAFGHLSGKRERALSVNCEPVVNRYRMRGCAFCSSPS